MATARLTGWEGTVRLVATFGSWLEAQAGRGDEVGQVASAWRDAKGKRPKASAPSTITRFMLADPGMVPGIAADRIEAVLVAATAQYHAGSHQSGPAVPSPILGPDLQPVRLASVPDHQEPVTGYGGGGEYAAQQPGQPGDGSMVDLTQPMVTSPQVMEVLQNFDERLTGLQELVSAVPAIHELLVALIQAMGPLIELGQSLDAKIDEAQAQAAVEDAAADLAGQLGIADLGKDERDQVAYQELSRITPAQQAAQEVAQRNGWMPREQVDWAGGLCEVHCREDRCTYGCDCPGHQPDGSHIVQTRAGSMTVPLRPGDQNVAAAFGQAADQGMRLYGGHIAPEPDWARYHELGEPGNG